MGLPPLSCGHASEKLEPSRIKSQLAGSRGGFQRRSPTGGAANGRFLNDSAESWSTPRTSPFWVCTTGASAKALVPTKPKTKVSGKRKRTTPSYLSYVVAGLTGLTRHTAVPPDDYLR